jgi:antibiotic biosynthesis monooxygenase (ABM) superfamily enzyme
MLREFIPQSFRFPGYLGVQILRQASGASPGWIVGIKFQGRGAYEAFRNSPEYLQWTAKIRDLLEADSVVEERCGLESWFVLSGDIA